MLDRNWKIQSDSHKTRYLGVFQVVDFKLEVKLQQFRIADPIWRTEIAKYNLICIKLGFWECSRSLIPNQEKKYDPNVCLSTVVPRHGVDFQQLHLRSLEEQSPIFFIVNTTWKNSEMWSLCIVVRFFYVRWLFFPELGCFMGNFS